MFRRSIFTVFTFRAMEPRLSSSDAIRDEDCRNASAAQPAQTSSRLSANFLLISGKLGKLKCGVEGLLRRPNGICGSGFIKDRATVVFAPVRACAFRSCGGSCSLVNYSSTYEPFWL
jgi:hypothetical protein